MCVPFSKILSCADAPLVHASSSWSHLKSVITQAVFGAMSGKIGRTPPHKDLVDPGHEQVGEGT